ncbi:CFS1-like protein [Sparassis latifolia]
MLRSLKNGLQHGHLVITEGENKHSFGVVGDRPISLSADIAVENEAFWVRVYLSHDLGFSEAYMHGDFTTSNLKAILDLWLANRDTLTSLMSMYSRVSWMISSIAVKNFGQTLVKSIPNVVTGYDCSNTFFQAILSKEMMYSCALWTDVTGGVRGDLDGTVKKFDLENAQLHKIHYLLKKARVRPGDRLLEFGSGWGAMAIEAAKMGCTVDTLTLSIQQKILAEQRVAEAGLSDKVRVHFMDYRNLPPEFEKAFDAFISVEMLEAVGVAYMHQYFKILDWALKSDRATAVMTATSQPESRWTMYQATDYARKYQWPNTILPSATYLANACQEAVPRRFVLEGIEDNGVHYPRTLREWGRRLQENWTPEMITEMLKDRPELSNERDLAIYKRKWEYMCVYAEVGYARAYTSMHYWTFARPDNPMLVCD